jgi:segregation and condensation protein B
MSLKAKLEAVIYAAEEPVTLTQLAALFSADALAWKVEQAAVRAEQAAEAAAEAAEPLPLLAEGLEYLGLEQTPAVYAAPEQEAAIPVETIGAEGEACAAAGAQAEDETVVEVVPAVAEGESSEQVQEPATAAEAREDLEAEAKRQARQRDREVKAILRQLLDELISNYASDNRGVEIREIAGGYRMATKPECHDAVRLFIKSLKPAMKLSLPALETLAVIAYKQPVTAPEVNEIRGVDSSGVFGSLLARKLITTAGRKPVIGRPILYKTTREFLLRFGLNDVSELPSMDEFEKMATMELDEAAGETDAGQEHGAGAEPELDENAIEEPLDEPAGETAHEPTAPVVAATGASSPEIEVADTTAEAAPDEPLPTEQAETEIPHD